MIILEYIDNIFWLTGLVVCLVYLYRVGLGVVRAWSLIEFLWVHAFLKGRAVSAGHVVKSFFLVLWDMLTEGPSTWTTQDGCYWSDWNDWTLVPREVSCEP